MATAETVRSAQEIRQAEAGPAFTPRQAKLYSQRLRRSLGREGLASFGPNDNLMYFDEAVLLLHASLIERDDSDGEGWRGGVRRAADMLDWLSQRELRPAGVPTHLLAAAAYQLAGYPAMALGHLRRGHEGDRFAGLLRDFLVASFPDVQRRIAEYWERTDNVVSVPELDGRVDLAAESARHVVMCVSTIVSFLRTGIDEGIERALTKLDHLAQGFLHSRDSASYLLAKLTAEVARAFVQTSLWAHLAEIDGGPALRRTLQQFAHAAFVNRRLLVWRAQKVGLERLRGNESFVLCTPTGSGKTTVAALAALKALFGAAWEPNSAAPAPLVLYLVPSRALAVEVESRFEQDLSGVSADRVAVTGLYGGIDWGPTDAWILSDRRTVAICTFEKADALIRFLGIHFLRRVRCVIVDEAHSVEQDASRPTGLDDASSRPYRLEQLTTRLLQAQALYQFRIAALSAVAARAAPALAKWLGGSTAAPSVSDARSTRQMVGRLQVDRTGQFTILYDLMDHQPLRFEDGASTETPYVREPFPALPPGWNGADGGPEVRLRSPTLWAALHLAAARGDGSRPSVLVSITQNVQTFAASCLEQIEAWDPALLPDYHSVDESNAIWSRCVASAADYFGSDSVEYRLLRHGIAVHHGKMPTLLARRLKVAIDAGLVRVTIATSTLSEGVNIPVNFLLLPSVFRGEDALTPQEFSNLVGRAGRPGVATEGSALVVLPERGRERRRGRWVPEYNRQWEGYEELVGRLSGAPSESLESANSPLALLMLKLRDAWSQLSDSDSDEAFVEWLERTAVPEQPTEAEREAVQYLDSLDAFLLASLEEAEQLRGAEVSPAEMDAALTSLWQRTYAFAASRNEAQLRQTWLARGSTLKRRYPNADVRRRIYRSSLTPTSSLTLQRNVEVIRARLLRGDTFASASLESRLAYVTDVLEAVFAVPAFKVSSHLGRRRGFSDWPRLLRWWMAKSTLDRQPAARDVANWFDFVAQNFLYRATWGLGSALGLILDTGEGVLELSDWPSSGLPWAAFWLKELITWGTLDPVAAYILARGDALDRPDAEQRAGHYYRNLPADLPVNERIDPRRIRDWLEEGRVGADEGDQGFSDAEIVAELTRPAEHFLHGQLRVTGHPVGQQLLWRNASGYVVAQSSLPQAWQDLSAQLDFRLDVPHSLVIGERYLRHLR